MKILELKVAGYRSLRDVSWIPGDLNIVIGPNGSGKSNLVRLLETLSLSSRGGLGRHIQHEGGMEPLLWDGRSREIKILLRTSSLQTRSTDRDPLTYQLDLERLGSGSTYRISNELLGNFTSVERSERSTPFKFLERDLRHAVVFDEKERALSPQEAVQEEETLLSSFAGPFSANRVVSAYQRSLSSWCIYQDIHTNRDAAIRQPVIARSERVVAPDGQNLVTVLHTLYSENREFKRDIHAAMTAAFGDDFEELVFPPAADQRIQLRVRWKSLQREQSAADLSDGTLRFLMLVAVLANPASGELIVIDEPETGLHPAMLPIVVDYAKEASRRSQVVFTTHSAEFLDAFDDCRPQTTVVRWLNGSTSLLAVDGDELDRWLERYTLGALFRSGELEGMG